MNDAIDPTMTPDQIEAEIDRLTHIADRQHREAMTSTDPVGRVFLAEQASKTRATISRLKARLRAHNTRHSKD